MSNSKKVFINFSNHPSSKWDKAQTDAASFYGAIEDMPFPRVDPAIDTEEVEKIASEYAERIMSFEPSAVMCQGEFTLCFSVVSKLKTRGCRVLSACSKRETVEYDGKKVSVFKFVRFREYI